MVSARLGVVLSKEGGLLAKLAPLFTVCLSVRFKPLKIGLMLPSLRVVIFLSLLLV